MDKMTLQAGVVIHLGGLPITLKSDSFVLGNKANFKVNEDGVITGTIFNEDALFRVDDVQDAKSTGGATIGGAQ